MASRLECSRLAGDSLVWQTLQLESGREFLVSICYSCLPACEVRESGI